MHLWQLQLLSSSSDPISFSPAADLNQDDGIWMLKRVAKRTFKHRLSLPPEEEVDGRRFNCLSRRRRSPRPLAAEGLDKEFQFGLGFCCNESSSYFDDDDEKQKAKI
jgi:hypothetical protein